MSHHKNLARTARTNWMASAWLDENLDSLASAITAETFSRNSELQEKYGQIGRRKCEEDAHYHLHYLGEAIVNHSEKMFLDYVAWAKIMLCSRGIRAEDLANNLEVMAQVLRLKAPRPYRVIFDRVLASASAGLPNFPEALPSFVDDRSPHGGLANRYLNSLLLLNREEAFAVVVAALEDGLSFADLFQHVIYPVQKEVGRLWQENRITVLQEHYCTAATDLLITSSKRKFLGNRRNVAALALCADGEEHCLGIKMFADLLEADGWRVAYVGSKSPVADVLKHITLNSTDLVAISVASPLHLAKVRELITKIRSLPLRQIPAVLVGGAAINSEPDLWKRLKADRAALSVSEGLEVANRIVAKRDRGNI